MIFTTLDKILDKNELICVNQVMNRRLQENGFILIARENNRFYYKDTPELQLFLSKLTTKEAIEIDTESKTDKI